MDSRLRIVVLGYVIRGPFGGLAWHYLQYVMGFARLGHEVYFLEDSEEYLAGDGAVPSAVPGDPTDGLRFAGTAFDRTGLGDRWAYYDAHRDAWLGPAASVARQVAGTADVLVNVSGVNPVREWMLSVPTRILIDTDPVFTQVHHLQDPGARTAAARHTAFFSFAENLGRPGCEIPADGFSWQPTRQPVVLDAWPVSPGPREGPLTSVLKWESYRSVRFDGRRYGMKSESFSPYLDLPARCGQTVELAGIGLPETLRERGWILEGHDQIADPWTYQAYIRRSKAEFGVCKHGYVVSRSGWFSERSAAYLASGRPVIVQDTGFSEWLRTDAGVLAFGTLDEAVECTRALDRDYERHCLAAREAAETYFDSAVVLRKLLDAAVTASDVRAIPPAPS